MLSPSDRPALVLVGGFLGAGKTTLLLRAARELAGEGLRVAIISNDQGGELVDTRWSEHHAVASAEVTGGCFCCRFSDLVQTAETLRRARPDVIFAEPVGSCTDLISTTIRPLEQLYSANFRVCPYTVLIDPRPRELDPHSRYLFEKQIEEADLLCYTRSDLVYIPPPIAGRTIRRLSGRNGEGVRAWLNEILGGEHMPHQRVLEIDYQLYAAAEAALGWVNWQASIQLRRALAPAQLLGPFLDDLNQRLTDAGIAIAHLKALDDASTGYLKASLTRNGENPDVEGMLDAEPARGHRLLVNLRAVGDPLQLRELVNQSAAALPGTLEVLHCEAFCPAPPVPAFRF